LRYGKLLKVQQGHHEELKTKVEEERNRKEKMEMYIEQLTWTAYESAVYAISRKTLSPNLWY